MPDTRVPNHIEKLAESARFGTYKRKSPLQAQAAMQKLGIPTNSEFYSFCSEFCLGCFSSKTSHESLVDVCDPSEEVSLGTKFIHEVWELPSEYISFTTCEGEGAFLYSIKTGGIYDFSLVEREQFIQNPKPRWQSFYVFLAWYLARGL
jgi:hypothetical protein